MDRIKPINSEKYLEKISKTDLSIREEELMRSVARLERPFEGLTSLGDEIDIKAEKYSIHITFFPNNQRTVYSAGPYRRYHRVEHLMLQHSEKIFDLTEIVPDGCKILVNRKSIAERGSVVSDGNIVIDGDITTPKMLLILLHEIGHVVDKMQLAGEDPVSEHPMSFTARKIRSERIATAFTLKFIRPFVLDSKQRKDVINFLKHDALRSYYLNAQKAMEEQGHPDASLDRYAQDISEELELEKDAEW